MFKGFYNELNEETINKWLVENSSKIENIVNISQAPYVGGGCMTVVYIAKKQSNNE
jgi:hypothetical protein